MNIRNLLGGALLAALVCVVSVRAEDKAPAPDKKKDAKEVKFDTPQAAFDAFVKGAKTKDIKKSFQALTPESGDKLLGFIVTMVGFVKQLMMGFDKDKATEMFKPIDKVMAKYGLKGDKFEGELKKALASIQDPDKAAGASKKIAALVKEKEKADLMGALNAQMEKMMKGLGQNPPKPDIKAALKELKVDGDKATGLVEWKSGDKEEKIKTSFKKIKGSWKMELSDEFFKLMMSQGRGG